MATRDMPGYDDCSVDDMTDCNTEDERIETEAEASAQWIADRIEDINE